MISVCTLEKCLTLVDFILRPAKNKYEASVVSLTLSAEAMLSKAKQSEGRLVRSELYSTR